MCPFMYLTDQCKLKYKKTLELFPHVESRQLLKSQCLLQEIIALTGTETFATKLSLRNRWKS